MDEVLGSKCVQYHVRCITNISRCQCFIDLQCSNLRQCMEGPSVYIGHRSYEYIAVIHMTICGCGIDSNMVNVYRKVRNGMADMAEYHWSGEVLLYF